MSTWHPKADRVVFPSPGPFTGGGNKLVWHSTEGTNIDACLAAYKAVGAPHFTIGITPGKSRILLQHIPIDTAAAALKHPSGTPETNHANAIQVEILGFAKDAQMWDPKLYHYLALLARWIEKHGHVPRESLHPFPGQNGYHRLSGPGWVKTSGHVGHCHCPNNDHVDPGNIRIGRILR